MPEERPFPPVPRALLEHLELLYPDRAPRLETSMDAVRYHSGAVSVVRLLRTHFERQNQET